MLCFEQPNGYSNLTVQITMAPAITGPWTTPKTFFSVAHQPGATHSVQAHHLEPLDQIGVGFVHYQHRQIRIRHQLIQIRLGLRHV